MIKIFIAEDVFLLRKALVTLLQMEADLCVVAEAGHGDEVVPQALATAPDVALIDINLPGTDGLTAAQELRERLPSCRLLIITSLANPAALRRAMAAQVDGYVLKDTSPDELVCAIRKVAAGQRVIDPQLALAAWEGPTEELTPRERTVLSLTARGDEVGEIAAELHLSNGTVRNYQTAIIQKLGARNRVDAIRIAREAGLT